MRSTTNSLIDVYLQNNFTLNGEKYITVNSQITYILWHSSLDFFSSIISSSSHSIKMYKVPGKSFLVSFTYWIVLHQWSLSLQCCETSFLQVYDCCRLRLTAYTHFVSENLHAIEVTGHKLYMHLVHFLRSYFLHLCLNNRWNLENKKEQFKIKTIG